VIGRLFTDHVLAAVAAVAPLPGGAGSGVRALDAQLLVLQRAQLIRERARLPEREYAFKHYLTHQAAYDSLLRRERRAYHRQAAEALERLYPERIEEQLGALAHHWERAGDAGKAIAYLSRAGEQAAAQFANAEAVAYLSRALDLVGEDDLAERYALLRAREGVLDLQGAREAQQEDLEALEALANTLADPIRQADVALRQAHYAARTQDYDAAATAARMAVAYAQGAQDVARQAAAHREVGRALRYVLNDEEAQTELERALLLARAAGARQVEADTLHELGALTMRPDDDYWADELRICREIGDRQREGRALRDFGLHQLTRGQYAKAIASFEESLRVCQQTGHRRDEGWALHSLGLVYDELGDYAGSRTYAMQAVSIHRATNDHLGMVWACAILARACVEEGDYVGAREWLAQTSEGGRMWCSGDVSWAQGDVERAKWEYEEALRLRRAASSEWPEAFAMCGLAAVALAEGNLGQAQGYTAKLLTDLEEYPWPIVFLGFRPHLVCYRVLRASEDPRADEVLEQAYGMLQKRAAQIEEEALRRSYLENVAVNREIVAEHARRH
jgi:tetratricopeptide (TPR) repeat protein